MTSDHTRPNRDTENAEEDEAKTEHRADRSPTPEEEAAAEETELSEDAARHYREAIERGAEVKGEGEIK